jgi:hypothetical protein
MFLLPVDKLPNKFIKWRKQTMKKTQRNTTKKKIRNNTQTAMQRLRDRGMLS